MHVQYLYTIATYCLKTSGKTGLPASGEIHAITDLLDFGFTKLENVTQAVFIKSKPG